MNADNILDSKLVKRIVLGIICFIILAFVFGLGVFVGTQKADFSFKWADEYHHNFGGPQGGFFGNMMGGDFTNSNGVFGQIIKIDGQNITMKSRDNIEKNVLTDNKTTIVCQRNNIGVAGLKTGDSIVVIGDPTSNGQIKAALIRVMPAPPASPLPGSKIK